MHGLIVPFLLLASFLSCVAQEAGEQVPEKHAWDVLVTQLGMEERSWLLTWDADEQGQILIDQYLAQYPDGSHREEALYLKAVGYWSLFQYEDAADAYARYLAAYPDQQRSSLAMTRHVQSLVRSDQPEEAIVVAEAYKARPAADQRRLVVVDAMLLQGNADEARAELQSMIDAADEDPRAGRMVEMLEARQQQLAWIGKPLASFDVKAWKTGESLTPGTFRGRVLLIEFWASWCRPCMAQMPHLVLLYGRLHKQGFDILGVDLDQDVTQLETVTKSMGMMWPQYNDGRKWDNAMAVAFDVRRIPFTILVDRDGIVRYVGAPAASLDRLVKALLEPEQAGQITEGPVRSDPVR